MFANTPNPTFFAALFSFAIVVTYMTVRRGWLRLPVASATGVIYTSVSFFLFALARGNSFPHAAFVGFFLGIIFTFAAAIIAGNFRALALESEDEYKQASPVLLASR